MSPTISVEESVGIDRPPAPGTRAHEVVRSSGRDYVADTVVTDLDPGASTGGMRFLTPLLRPMVRSGLRKDLQTLKTLLEAGRS